MNIKTGTRVEIANAGRKFETGHVMRWHKSNGSREDLPGYHKIKFDDDGAVLMVHESSLRVIDNAVHEAT